MVFKPQLIKKKIDKNDHWESKLIRKEVVPSKIEFFKIEPDYERFNHQFWISSSLLKLNSYFEKVCKTMKSSEEEWKELGFTPISNFCFDYTCKVVSDIIYDIWTSGITLSIPEILPCSDGSINIHWEMEDYQILINIPNQEKELIDYYGKNLHDDSKCIMGKCPMEMLNEVIYKWVMKTHPLG